MGNFRPETARTMACKHRPPARESVVSAEIVEMLRTRYFACQLKDYETPAKLVKGQLVFMVNEFRRKPLGVDPGIPDLWISRVECWGWHGAELKERGKNGQCDGTLSIEQKTAVGSGLYIEAWAPEHVAQLITEQDNQARAREAAAATKTGAKHGKKNSKAGTAARR